MGSFLNVVIHRYPQMLKMEWELEHAYFSQDPKSGETERSTPATATLEKEWIFTTPPAYNLAMPRSACVQCKKPIPFWLNIPIFSYLYLKGRCAYCQTPIPLRYLIIELLTPLLSIALFLHFGLKIQLLVGLVLTGLLITLSAIDFEQWLLPDGLTLSALWLGLLCNSDALFVSPTDAIWGAMLGYLLPKSIATLYRWVRKKPGMGGGDFKLLAALGAWFGPLSIPILLLLAAILALFTLLMKRLFIGPLHWGAPFPFGPFLAISGWFFLVFGQSVKGILGA